MLKPAPSKDAGFTLTELIAGLLVASLLLAGIVDIIRRYASTTVEVKAAATDIRDQRLLDAMMDELVRLDPGSLRLTPLQIDGAIGGAPVSARLTREPDAMRLQWSSPNLQRSLVLPRGATFSQLPSGAIAVIAPETPTPLGLARPRRTLPFDCQFDTVSRTCRP
ncbi:MAG: hypothetical protein RIR33_1885 [Pseudomonadota bacterium]|jgi:prepilin-type N-terminal cleavage/methylation domain-containing protein